MNNLKSLLGAGMIIAGIAIILIVYTVWTKNPSSEPSVNTNMPIPQEQQQPEESADNTLTYTNNSGGYSFQYDKRLAPFRATMTIYSPQGKSTQQTVDAFRYEIPVEYCALSGKCKPTTTNMSIGSTIRTEDFNADSYPDLTFERKNYGKISVYEAQMGAEGEGIVYTYIPLPNNRLLIVYRTFIDENTLINYKTAKGFIPLTQQEQIYSQIISSIK